MRNMKFEELVDIMKGIVVLGFVIWILVIIGQQFNWWYWIPPFLVMAKKIFIIVLVIVILIGISYGIYLIKNWKKIKIRKEQKRKKIELEMKAEEKERKKKEAEEKKERETRTNLILKRVLKKRKEYLEDTNKEEREYLKTTLKKQIREYIEGGNNDANITDYLGGDRTIRLTKLKGADGETEDKYIEILKTIEKYPGEDRTVRDEREFETGLYNYLKAKFPEYNVIFQYPTERGGKVDIVIDDEIALELKVADTKGALNDVFSKINWYSKEFDKLAIIILDVDAIDDLDEYVHEFEEKDVEVVVVKGRLSMGRLHRR